MKEFLLNEDDIINLLKPETPLEHLILSQKSVLEGLLWGEPRYGHPEGKVVFHVEEVFANINAVVPPFSEGVLTDTISDREKLRIIALLHDTFKFREDKTYPRDWSRHHGRLAREFAEAFITDEDLLDIIELHDEAYYCWRLEVLNQRKDQSAARFRWLLDRLDNCVQLFYIFFKCDTATGDKTQAPVKWFEKKMLGLDLVSLKNNE
jgi:HD domain